MYDHTKQYRCDIIRGKTLKDMDDLLSAYAKVIDEVCPCEEDEFNALFNNALSQYLSDKKTLDNHRTEISHKLFGMYYVTKEGMVYQSDRTKKYLEDNDQPAFFKDICYKMQFPNGMQADNTIIERMESNISCRPCAFVIKVLAIAKTANVDITKNDIAYYVLNSLDVLQGNASPYEVLDTIVEEKKNEIKRKIVVPGKAYSFTNQHINELLKYMQLSNLIRITKNKRVILNPKEQKVIDLFLENWDKKPEFDVYEYDLKTEQGKEDFHLDWDLYYSTLSHSAGDFETTAEALMFNEEQPEMPEEKTEKKDKGTNLTEFGDEGEKFVYNYEKERVSKFKPILANKVLSLGKTKGLGYDIQSVIAEPGDMAEFVKYIEVKSTKRLTAPDINDTLWVDTINITRNEWVAAQQHGQFYSIFRVYFTREGVVMFVLKNVAEKLNNETMQATPTTYRVDFSNKCVDNVIQV